MSDREASEFSEGALLRVQPAPLDMGDVAVAWQGRAKAAEAHAEALAKALEGLLAFYEAEEGDRSWLVQPRKVLADYRARP